MPSTAFKDIDKRIEESSRKTVSWKNLVEQSGYKLKSMDNDEITNAVCQYLNLDFIDRTDEINNMCENSKTGLKIGHKMANVVSVVGQSEELSDYGIKDYFGRKMIASWAYPLHWDLEVPHIVTTTLTKTDRDQALKDYKTELLLAKQLASNSPGGQKSAVRGAILENAITQAEARKDGFVDFSTTITTFSTDTTELKENTEKVVTAVQSMAQAKVLNESYDALNIFMANLPGNGFENVRSIKMPTMNALPYFMWYAAYEADNMGELYTDRHGKPIRIDLNIKKMDAWNKIVIGPTGSGKSFSTGSTVCTAVERGEVVVLIDIGGSYSNIMDSLGGVNMRHSAEAPMKFNPFLTDKNKAGKYAIDGNKINVLKALLTSFWKQAKHGEYLSNAESSLLDLFLEEYYNFANEQLNTDPDYKPMIKKFVDWLYTRHQKKIEGDKTYKTQMKFFDMEHFVLSLRPYTNGMYSKIFNNEDAMNLSDCKLLAFDLEGVKQDPKLYPIVTMLIIELVLSHIAKYPKVFKHVILDEAWSFFTGDMQVFIEEMYRTIRKLNGGVSVVTQSANDIASSPIANALIQNTQVYTILNHGDKDTSPLLKIGITENNVKKIESMRRNWVIPNGKGGYVSGGWELFIQRQNIGGNVYAGEVPIEQYAILTSDKIEKAHLDELMKEYPIDLAIEMWKHDKSVGKIKNQKAS
jgi:type IV secretory pathway VirB4 component